MPKPAGFSYLAINQHIFEVILLGPPPISYCDKLFNMVFLTISPMLEYLRLRPRRECIWTLYENQYLTKAPWKKQIWKPTFSWKQKDQTLTRPLNIFFMASEKDTRSATNSLMLPEENINILNKMFFRKAAHLCCTFSSSAILLQSNKWHSSESSGEYVCCHQGHEACTSDLKWIYITQPKYLLNQASCTCWHRFRDV